MRARVTRREEIVKDGSSWWEQVTVYENLPCLWSADKTVGPTYFPQVATTQANSEGILYVHAKAKLLTTDTIFLTRPAGVKLSLTAVLPTPYDFHGNISHREYIAKVLP